MVTMAPMPFPLSQAAQYYIPQLINLGARRPPPRKIIMSLSLHDDVQLNKSENAWKPGMKRESLPAEPESQRTQDLFKKVRSILNKLTPQKFSQLMKQVTDLPIDTEERLKGVIDLVFEKAIDEPSFSVAYANMCGCLATLKVPTTDKPNNTLNFRKLLLHRCQKEFEKDKVDDVVFERKQKELDSAASTERDRLQVELQKAKDITRRRSIGNIKFIGELFKVKMLAGAVVQDCVVKLLKNHDEESLECLCRLLTTIGKDLDLKKAKPRMDQYFNQMEKIAKEKKTSSRIRFMLQDIIDLRSQNWVSRRADQGPKTIEQIHKEAKIEEQEEQRKVQQQLLSKDTERQPDPREQGDQRVQREETVNTVSMTKDNRTIDPNKIPKFSKPQMDEKIYLGPPAHVTWVKGCSGGAEASDSDNAPKLQPVVQKSSLPGLVQPEAPVERPVANTPESEPTPPTSEPELPLPASVSTPVNLPLTAANSSEHPSARESTTSHRSSVGEQKPSLAPPQPPITDESLLDAPGTLAALTVAAPKALNGLAESGTELETAAHEPSLMPPAALQPQMDEKIYLGPPAHVTWVKGCSGGAKASDSDNAPKLQPVVQKSSSTGLVQPEAPVERPEANTPESEPTPAYRKASSDPLPSDMRPQVPIDAALAPVALVPVTLSSSPAPALPIMLAPGLPPLVQATTEADEASKSIDTKDLVPRAGTEAQGGITDSKRVSQHQALIRNSPTTVKPEPVVQTIDKPARSEEEIVRKSERIWSPKEVKQQLEGIASDEQVFDCVEKNLDESQMSSPPLLRALMTAVLRAAVKDITNCRVHTALIRKRLPVLLKYRNSEPERQLQALYALQALIVALGHPPNLLRIFFDYLYDEDFISKDAFYKWETSKDPAEQLGKGVALKSVTAFFTWLREEESEDN